MNEKIIEEIKALKNEEAFQNSKLENKKNHHLKYFQKSKDEIIKNIEFFENEINYISTLYNEFKETEKITKFISFSNFETYEFIETDISDIIDEHLNKLKNVQTNILKFENETDNKIVEEEEKNYQKSLYLKHEAQMIEIEARLELSSLEAQIDELTTRQSGRVVENVESLSLIDVSKCVRELCVAESALEMRRYVEQRLEGLQQGGCLTVGELVKLWRKCWARGRLRREALQGELSHHDGVLQSLSSAASIVADLADMREQLRRTEQILTVEGDCDDDDLRHNDSQTLARVRGLLPHLVHNSTSSLLTIETNEQLNNDNKALLLELVDKIDSSKLCLENICENVQNLYGILKNNRAPGSSDRLSLVNETNADSYDRLSSSANKIRNELKLIKNRVDKLDSDVI